MRAGVAESRKPRDVRRARLGSPLNVERRHAESTSMPTADQFLGGGAAFFNRPLRRIVASKRYRVRSVVQKSWFSGLFGLVRPRGRIAIDLPAESREVASCRTAAASPVSAET